jgi:hypothetical protein
VCSESFARKKVLKRHVLSHCRQNP